LFYLSEKSAAMKKLFTTLFLACLFSLASGQTNVYNPFPIDSAYWSVAHGGSFDGCYYTIHYGMLGDTLIEGNSYSKIWQNTDSVFNPSNATYFAALREDSTKKVFVRTYFDTTDVLLYDFSLEVGDTFCFEFFSGNCHTVQAIDSILIGNSFRRVIHIPDSEPQQWIEGIGNIYGLFDNMVTGSIYNELLCFQQNNSLLYFSFGPGCYCDNHIGISENISMFSSTVFPNPATNSATIDFENPTNANFGLQVFDITGRTVIEQNIKTNRTQLNTQNLPPGIYQYRLISEKERRQNFGKFVVE
jgi:hypothetical protein